MDEETKARFDDVSAALGTINSVLAEIIEGMVTKKELDAHKKELDARFDAIMARMNDGFERVLAKQQTLQVADDTLSQRVTRLEQDVRQLRGGI
jgi:predicted ATP-grasp superfamily ATP-dependent carboligase